MKPFQLCRPGAASFGPACTLTLFAMAAVSAWGDYECVGGHRDTTLAEREAMRIALEAARSAMPAVPEGWVPEGDDSISVMQSLCRDFEQGPWRYGYHRNYQRIDDREARDEILKDAAVAMQDDIAAKQERMDALMARVMELSQQAAAAGEKQDFERVEAVNRQIEAVSGQIEALMAEGDADDNMQAAVAEAGRDISISLSVYFNASRDNPGYEARHWSPAGVPGKAFRWSASRDGVEEESVLILIGDWQAGADGNYEFVPSERLGAAVPQSIAVRVTADPGRIDELVAAIDFGALQGLLARR